MTNGVKRHIEDLPDRSAGFPPVTQLCPSGRYIDRRYARPRFSGGILGGSEQIHGLADRAISRDQFLGRSATIIGQYAQGLGGHATQNFLPLVEPVLDISREIHAACDSGRLPIEL